MNRYGPMIVSMIILALFGAHMMGFGLSWAEGDQKLMETCLTLVVGYWLGSSHGSAMKTDAKG